MAATSETKQYSSSTVNLVRSLREFAVPLAIVPAIVATLGSLYYSEIAGYIPCTLCWYQRILMYPLTVILLVGIFSEDWLAPRYVLPLSMAGMGVSFYHILYENGVFHSDTICRAGVSCAVKYVNYLGFITIPVMAFTAFTLITGLMLAANWAYSHPVMDEEETVVLEEEI